MKTRTYKYQNRHYLPKDDTVIRAIDRAMSIARKSGNLRYFKTTVQGLIDSGELRPCNVFYSN